MLLRASLQRSLPREVVISKSKTSRGPRHDCSYMQCGPQKPTSLIPLFHVVVSNYHNSKCTHSTDNAVLNVFYAMTQSEAKISCDNLDSSCVSRDLALQEKVSAISFFFAKSVKYIFSEFLFALSTSSSMSKQ